ncbi:hypothetical protein VIGAN_03026500, partial [Vigna angularis var. angularis]
ERLKFLTRPRTLVTLEHPNRTLIPFLPTTNWSSNLDERPIWHQIGRTRILQNSAELRNPETQKTRNPKITIFHPFLPRFASNTTYIINQTKDLAPLTS